MDINYISSKYNLSPIVVSLIKSRGVDSEKALKEFTFPTDKSFHDPFLLKDMDRLVDRINRAIKDRDRVVIFGDYDVDGITATAVLIKYFLSRDLYVAKYIPDRHKDGYGLSKDVILKIKDLFDPSLIITVDCGVTSYEEVEFAKTLGIEIVITDHHNIQDKIPDTIVVDPHIPGQDYPFKDLCGAGVALKVVQALGGIEEMRKYLGIVAIATIADMVPLLDENRAIVKLGMQDFDKNLPLGIKMLFEENKLSLNPSAKAISFKICPIINASARMGDSASALKLYMINEHKDVLKELIKKLCDMNEKRKEICDNIYNMAKLKLYGMKLARHHVIVLYDKASSGWDDSFLGIVASHISKEFHRPTILLSEKNGVLKGSARSTIDIFTPILKCKSLLESFGGHRSVAGLTLKKENLSAFVKKLDTLVSRDYSLSDFIPVKTFECDLRKEEVDLKLLDDLKLLEPYGAGNPQPIFNIRLGSDAVISTFPRHLEHIKIEEDNLSIVAFNSYDYMPLLKNSSGREMRVVLDEKTFGGKKYINEVARDIVTGKLTLDSVPSDILTGAYLWQFAYGKVGSEIFDNGEMRNIKYSKENNSKITVYNLSKLKTYINKMIKGSFGTLFVCFSRDSYKKLCDTAKDTNLKHYLFNVISNEGLNAVVVSPMSSKNFNAYKNIVFLDPVLSKKYARHILKINDANIYVPDTEPDAKKLFGDLKFDRQTFAKYFRIFSDYAKNSFPILSEFELFTRLKKIYSGINFAQYIFCLYVFLELKIFTLEKEENLTVMKENKKRSSLSSSLLYTSLMKKVVGDTVKTKKLDKKQAK